MKAKILSTAIISLMFFAVSAKAVAQDVHSIGSHNDALELYDAKWCKAYDKKIAEDTVVSWFDGTTSAYARAEIKVPNPFPIGTSPYVYYIFELVSVISTADDEVIGYWDIYRDGVLVENNQWGHAYGLTQPVGDYFKIVIDVGITPCAVGDWAFVTYVTDRFDY